MSRLVRTFHDTLRGPFMANQKELFFRRCSLAFFFFFPSLLPQHLFGEPKVLILRSLARAVEGRVGVRAGRHSSRHLRNRMGLEHGVS